MSVLKSKSLLSLMGVALLGCVFSLLRVQPVSAVSSGTCQTISVEVRLTPLLPKNQTAVGDLCTPSTWAEGAHRVDILVHGATYNRSYWDWPTSQPTYSYVERTLQQGRATFAYDRLGVGDSSRPLSPLATTTADAYILHQLVGWAHSNQGFSKVNVVGHSFGSIVAVEEEATYHDADLLVATGLIHAAGQSFTQFPQFLTAANADPQFSGQGYDLGYLTTQPGARGPFFYSSSADPNVIAYDEAHKDVLPSGQAPGLSQLILPPLLSQSIYVTTDVLVINGQEDVIYCEILLNCTNPSNVTAHETPYYPNASSLTVETIADTGHNLALHPSAGTSFSIINQWIQTH